VSEWSLVRVSKRHNHYNESGLPENILGDIEARCDAAVRPTTLHGPWSSSRRS
jgi:hypothetical protein